MTKEYIWQKLKELKPRKISTPLLQASLKRALNTNSTPKKKKINETSDNEKEHAKIWYKILHDGGVPDTAENLKDAIAGEEYEETEMYVKFAKEAREEGFEEIAKLFEEVGKIEAEHEKRYRKLLDNLEKGIVFKGDGVTVWKCRNCGYIHIGDSAPEECPVCQHPQAYFEIQAENY